MKSYAEIRGKWKQLLTGGNGLDWNDPVVAEKVESITKEAEGCWKTMLHAEEREALWEDLRERNSAYVTAAYRRLRAMTLAWNLKGSPLYQNDELRTDILDALDWMIRYRYNGEFYKDWWDWQIGSPMALNDCVILMYDELSEIRKNQYMRILAGYMGDPEADLGANRSWKCRVYALYGAITESFRHLEHARDCFATLFEYVSEDDGMYRDGSFIQHHDHPYNMGYGINLLEDMSDFLYLLDDSPWKVISPKRRNVYDWIYQSYEPFIYRGLAMDMVRGRETARWYCGDDDAGRKVMSAIVGLTRTAPEKDAAEFRRMLCEWLKGDILDSFYKKAERLDIICLTREILRKQPEKSEREPLGCRYFPSMDRMVQHRGNYAVGISMHSSRIANYEANIKNENRRGWHTGDGMIYLYDSDLARYHDQFWPTVDSHRLAGTTVLAGIPLKNDQKSLSSWTGGTTLDGFGVCGMEYRAFGHTLSARKSWFLFDHAIVAFGAGIRSKESGRVETVVENRKISPWGDSALSVNGKTECEEYGMEEELRGVYYAYLAGEDSGKGTGYVFPGGTILHVLREKRTDSWRAINGNPAMSCPETYTRDYQTMWIDHGEAPSCADYSYVLLPEMEEGQVREYAEAPAIEILRNDEQVQAVKEKELGITGINFWTRTEQSAAGICCGGAASFLLKETENMITLAVSDPTWENEKIRICIERKGEELINADEKIEARELSPRIVLDIDMAGSRGRTLRAGLRLQKD